MYDKFSIKALKNPTFNILHIKHTFLPISLQQAATEDIKGFYLVGGGGGLWLQNVSFFFLTLTGKSIWHSFYIYVIIYVISSSGKGAIYHQFELKIKVISPIQITDKTPHNNNYQYSSQYVKTFKLI